MERTNDIFLSPDERYVVWEVKWAERPELLSLEAPDEVDDDNDNERQALPLQDGCDIAGWRHGNVVHLSQQDQGVLRVGPGCSLLRRSSQLLIVGMNSTCKRRQWETLKERLLLRNVNDTRRLPRIEYTDTMEPYQWFERENIPVVLIGCTTKWKAIETCTFSKLVERFGNLYWRFSDLHGETMSLHTYKKYCANEGSVDDAPLGIYDSQFGFDERVEICNNEYSIPNCFSKDLFHDVMIDEELRPPYRWILIGPARSGTGLHIDPVGTHAWVTLIEGCKRWVLFPRGTDPRTIGMQQPQIPSVLWFRDYYPHIIGNHPDAIEVIQYPGETVYVPTGWPHLVLNLNFSVAITHNYATEFPCFTHLCHAIQEENETEFADRFRMAISKTRPDLVEQFPPKWIE